MISKNELLQKNKAWAQSVTKKNADFFTNLSTGQSPQFLWIGCSDSRVPATQVCDLNPGDVFVHRNIANVIVHTDMSSMSVIQYAVQYLKVSDVIICGHYGCGGVAGAVGNDPLGPIDNWLRNIKDVYDSNNAELSQMQDGTPEKVNRLVELNVAQQVKNICNTTIIQEAWKRGQDLNVHGLVYDLENGQLKDLDISVSSADQVNSPYRYNL